MNIPSVPPKFGASLVAKVVPAVPPLVVDQLAVTVSQVPLVGADPVPEGPAQNLLAARAEPAIPTTASAVTIFLNRTNMPGR